MELKHKLKSVVYVDYNDLDSFITAHYGHDFEVVAAEECGNDTSLEFRVYKRDMDDWTTRRVNEFKSTGEYSYSTSDLLLDLVNQNLIPEGDYIVRVSW